VSAVALLEAAYKSARERTFVRAELPTIQASNLVGLVLMGQVVQGDRTND
jgi:hypothetical protein